MSGHCTPPGERTSGSSRPTNPASDGQLRASRIVRIQQEPGSSASRQPGATRSAEGPPLTQLQFLETHVERQYNFIQRLFRPWLGPQQAPQMYPHHQFISIDPNFQKVVNTDFVAQALQEHVELRDVKKALDKKTEECERFRQQWQAEVKKHADVDEIKDALREKTEECDNIREHWQAAIGELSDIQSSKPSFMVDDAEMTAKWKQLQYAIKNLARRYLCHPISPEQLTHDQRELLESVNPLYQEILGIEDRVHLLFQSLVWMFITNRVLENPTVVWGERISAAATTLFKMKPNSREDYHAWRAQTAEILQDGKSIDIRRGTSLKDSLHSMIVQFIPERALSDNNAMIIHNNVEGIIDKAIELAVIFNQSRCDYRVKTVIYRQRFNSKLMHYDEEYKAPQVDLMISPVLMKYGNSKGENYDDRLIIAKSHVYSFNQHTKKGSAEEETLIDL